MCAPHTHHRLSNTPPHPLKPGATCRSQRVTKAADRAGLEGWPEGGGGGCSLAGVLPLGEQPSAGGAWTGRGRSRRAPRRGWLNRGRSEAPPWLGQSTVSGGHGAGGYRGGGCVKRSVGSREEDSTCREPSTQHMYTRHPADMLTSHSHPHPLRCE